MGLGDISLTAGMRSNLLNLQTTSNLMERTQERLSSGKEVNSALDNPTNYFAAKSHMDKAGDLEALKDGMSEGIQLIKAADAGIEGITTLVETAQGLLTSARSSDTATRSSLASQFNDIMDQIDALASDTQYKGKALIKATPDSLVVKFDETSSITIVGQDLTSGASGLNVADATNNWTADSDMDTAENALTTALTSLRDASQTLSSNLSVITARQDFTSEMINVLETGADNLTLADMNEESANMLMLQTRQSLGTTSLSLASQAAQSVLALF
jgi:flagellin-like hook-associated protein FlgL